MSEDETPDSSPETSPETSTDASTTGSPPEDALLDRLDEPGGMDALVEEFKRERAGRARRRARPIWVPVFVMAVGAYLLWGLWSDALYSARSDATVEDLGHARALFADGIPDGLDGKQVRLEGTPDVQHVARRKRKSGQTTGFMRLQEGGGSLFVAVPRRDGQHALEYDGVFVGRMQRMSRVPGFESLRAYFDRDGIRRVLDADRASFVANLGPEGIRTLASAEDGEGTWTLTDDDEVRLVFRPSVANVQLGRGTWASEADADAAVAALGLAWRRAEPRDAELTARDRMPFRSYQVAVPLDRADALEGQLNAIVPPGASDTDPKIGALVLPTIFAYTVAPTEVRRVDDTTLAFVYGQNTAPYGVELREGALVDRALDGGELHMPVADLATVRVERPVRVDPDGYIVIVGERPSDQRINGVLFVVVLGLVIANAVAFVLILRRRRED